MSVIMSAAACPSRRHFTHINTLHTLPTTLCAYLHTTHTPRTRSRTHHNVRHNTYTVAYRHLRTTSAAHASLQSLLITTAAKSLSNGILSDDDYLLHGMPPPRYTLNASESLAALFAKHKHIDPYQCVAADLASISESIRKVIGSDHIILSQIAAYFFNVNGKRIRPTVVLLLSRALNFGLTNTPPAPTAAPVTAPVSPSRHVNGVNGGVNGSHSVTNSYHRVSADHIAPEQHRISEIAEMIHTASLLHDDVIDDATTRRSVPTVNAKFGNKFAILAGDFLLSRASVALARLRHPQVIELMSMVVEHLVKGEIMQMKQQTSDESTSRRPLTWLEQSLSTYLTKTYYKTASLLANSSRSASLLGAHNDELSDIAYEYGRGMGLAFQIIDDILDCVGQASAMGKLGGGSDLKHGVLTAPVLFAIDMSEEMRTLAARKWSFDGDIARAMTIVSQCGAIERARELAESFAASACAAVNQLNPSTAQSALIQLCQLVLNRDR